MPCLSWLRRSKKPEAKAAATTSSNPTSLPSTASNLVTAAAVVPGPSYASSDPQSNRHSCGSLWDKAYEDLKSEKKNLVDVFEKLLLSEPETQSTSTLADGDSSKREKQMSALVAKKLEKMKEKQWKLQMGEKPIEIRQQIERIVKVVLVGKDFISSAASMDPIHTGLPWAGVCMLLPLITKDSEQRTAATDGLEYIAGLIRRYTQVEQIYLADQDFALKGDLQSSITELYRHVLEYEARAACQFNRNTAYQWARNLVEADGWKTIIGTIKDLETACDKLTWVIDAKDQQVRTARLESYLQRQNHEVRELFRVSREQDEEQGKLQLAELKAGRQEQRDWHRNAEESACYECLRTTDYESNKNKNPDRIPGTCEWFLRHPKYKKWLEEQWSTWLWVTADPGCGKSVLSRFLIDEYKKGPSDANTICYYFFKDDSEEGRSATHALCAILHQLFSQNNTLLRHAIPEYRRNGNKLPQLFNELWSIFISAATDPDAGSIVCIVDALDECAETMRLLLIRALARYYQNSGPTTKLKFIVVSRPYASIGDAFCEENPKVASVQLMGESEAEMEDIRVEIDLVIQEKVRRFNSRRLRKGVNDDAHIALQEELRSIENRTYLWVALVFPELEKKAGLAKSKLLQLIKIIPKSVDEAYERILSQSSDREQAKKLLHIVVAAERPLNLTEMNIALSMKEGATSMEDLELEPEPSFRTTVRELCGLFVVIRNSTVYFIHQTAKEFLVPDNTTSVPASTASGLDSWRHSLQPAKSNHVLAMICISYLSFKDFESDPLVLDTEDRGQWTGASSKRELFVKKYEDTMNAYVDKHPFLEYAAENWSLHSREAKSLGDPVTLKAALTICASHSNRLRTWFPIHWRYWTHWRDPSFDSGPTAEDVTALMVGSYHGLEEIVSTCLAQGAEINLKDSGLGWTALIFATEEGYEAIVEILLENGAEVNAETNSGDTPLMVAVFRANEATVETLLRLHADPNMQRVDGDTALMIAAYNGHGGIVKMLLESNADSYKQDKDGETVLMTAAMNGHGEIVKMLLESNADPNIQSVFGFTALTFAAAEGKETSVKMLLESSAEPNIQDEYGMTALMEAAAKGNAEIVKMLLESNADSNIHSKYGQTALMHTARSGNAEIMRCRLESSTDPNIQSEYGMTALMEAAAKGNAEIVKMLLESNADPNIQDKDGYTALMIAADSRNETMVKILLEKRANPMIQTDKGKTAMTVAKEKKANLDIYLREVGDAEQRSELLARATRSQAIIEMLHFYETEPAEISKNYDDRSNTSALSSTPDLNRSEEVITHKNEDPLDKIGQEASCEAITIARSVPPS